MTSKERDDAFARLTNLSDNGRSLAEEIRQAPKPGD
jgi:hypothetical protein